MNRKLLIISIVILVIVGFVGGIYLFSGGSENEESGGFLGLFPEREGGDVDLRERRAPIETSDEFAFVDELEEGGSFVQITNRDVAGGVVFASSTARVGTTTEVVNFVRYVEMGTGHIYERNMLDGKEERISNTTIHKTHNTVWSPDGKVVLIQYQNESGDTINNFVAYPDSSNSSGELDGEFLPENIGLPDFSPDSSKLAYAISGGSGSQIVVYDVSNRDSEVIYDSTIGDWRVFWTDSQNLVLNTKPSGTSTGYAYLLNTNSGTLTKVIGDINGLLLNQDSSGNAIYNFSTRQGIETVVLDGSRETGLETVVTEKCAWSQERTGIAYCGAPGGAPNGTYPDDWYLGDVSFNDLLWEVDTNSGLTRVVASPEEERGFVFDITNPQLSDEDKYFLFENKKDHTLWFYVFGQL